MKTVAIVLSGGRGKRMGSDMPKQYIEYQGFPLIYYPLKTMQESFIDEIVLVCSEDYYDYCQELVADYELDKVTQIVIGGKERYHSVYAGLQAIEDADYVFIHDGARAFVDNGVLERCLADVKKYDACVAAMPVKDTIKVAKDGFIVDSPDRSKLYAVQTPQCFKYELIKSSYERMIEEETTLLTKGAAITDDTYVFSLYNDKPVYLSEGSYENIKVTTPEDLR